MTRQNRSSRYRTMIPLVALTLTAPIVIALGAAWALDGKYRPLENRPWGDLRTKPPTPDPKLPPAPTVPPGMRGGVAAPDRPPWGQPDKGRKRPSDMRSDGLKLAHLIDRQTKNPLTASGCDNKGRTGGCWQSIGIPDGRGGVKIIEIAYKYLGGPPFDGQENLLMNELKKAYAPWNANHPTGTPEPKHR
jgi:hypothetical protein